MITITDIAHVLKINNISRIINNSAWFHVWDRHLVDKKIVLSALFLFFANTPFKFCKILTQIKKEANEVTKSEPLILKYF